MPSASPSTDGSPPRRRARSALQRACACFPCCRDPSADYPFYRQAWSNASEEGRNINAAQQFISNEVKTSIYTPYDFLPRFLFYQFQRLANAYFLVVCILQAIPAISITSGFPSSSIPLTSVVGFDGLLTAIEDWKRHHADDEVNGRLVTRISNKGTWEEVESKDLKVGDRVKIRSGETVPADCVLLVAKHEAADADAAMCFVKTAQLDGESNLKIKRTPKPVADHLASNTRLARFKGYVEAGPPDADFHRFAGNIIVPDPSEISGDGVAPVRTSGRAVGLPQGLEVDDVSPAAAAAAARLAKASDGGRDACRRFAVGAEALLLRGTEVRGVEFAVGLVVFTGNECKIRVKAAKKPRPKSPLMERQLNTFLVGIIIAQLLLCILGAFIDNGFLSAVWDQAWYLRLDLGTASEDGHTASLGRPTLGDGVQRALTFFLLTAQFIPVSLYVSIRVARQLQQLAMQLDRAMAYKLEGTAAAAAVADREARKAAAKRKAKAAAAEAAHGGGGGGSGSKSPSSSSDNLPIADWPDTPHDPTNPSSSSSSSAVSSAVGGSAMAPASAIAAQENPARGVASSAAAGGHVRPAHLALHGPAGKGDAGLSSADHLAAPSPLSTAHPDVLGAAHRHAQRLNTSNAHRASSLSTTHTGGIELSPVGAHLALGETTSAFTSPPATAGSVGPTLDDDDDEQGEGGTAGSSNHHGGSARRRATGGKEPRSAANPLAAVAGGSAQGSIAPRNSGSGSALLSDPGSPHGGSPGRSMGEAVRHTRSGTRRTDAAAGADALGGGSGGRAVGRSSRSSTASSTAQPAKRVCCGACEEGSSFECCNPGPEARELGGHGWCMAPVYSLFPSASDGRSDPPPVIFPVVRTMELNDDLGQVTHIFSDKTGTLTQNQFEHRKLSVAGVEYGRGTTTIGLARLRRLASEAEDAAAAGKALPPGTETVTPARLQNAEAVLEEGARAVRPLPHVNFLDGVDTPSGPATLRSLATDLGVPPPPSGHASASTDLPTAWLHAAAAASRSPAPIACPGNGAWASTHVALGHDAGTGQPMPSGRQMHASSSSSSSASASAATGKGGSGSAIEAVVRDAGRSPVAALPLSARAALGAELRHFFLNVALDHSVELETRKDADGRVRSVGLSASSPDEEAFVAMAAMAGWEFVGRSKGVARLLLPDARVRPYRTVADLPYTQARRMMSVLVELPDAGSSDDPRWATDGLGGGKYALYAKGADSKIGMLSAGYDDEEGVATAAGLPASACASPAERAAAAHNAVVAPATNGHMERWAGDGLRTLAFAWRPLPREWVESDCGVGSYEAWRAACNAAHAARASGKSTRRLPSATGASSSSSSGRVGWLDLWDRANQDLKEKEKKEQGQPNAIDDAMAVLERGLRWQGATGIEDRLQSGVPESVAALRDAGIKVYMLTGDKRDTAVNIGYAVQLLTEEHRVVQLTKDMLLEDSARIHSGAATAAALGRFGLTIARPPASEEAEVVEQWLADVVEQQLSALDPDASRRSGGPPPSHYGVGSSSTSSSAASAGASAAPGSDDRPLALVLDDPVLAALMGERGMGAGGLARAKRIRSLARRVMEGAESVVCCRCSPSHKKAVVSLIKYGERGGGAADGSITTLAVGDGANDVEMIMEAAVGVGIQGAEGAQAANAADYSFGQFRFLQRLLLVHGRWNYRRMAYLVLYSLYKNFQFTMVTYFLQVYMGFSGQKVIVEAAIQTFNLVYTSFPIIWAAVLDQDLDQDSAQRFPFSYTEGRLRSHMACWRFAAWGALGVWEGAVIAFGLAWFFNMGASPGPWSLVDVFSMGQAAFTSMILLLSVQVALSTHMHHWSFQLVLAVSALLWLPAAVVFNNLNADGTRGAVPLLFGSAGFWLCQLLILAAALLPMLAARTVQRLVCPTFARRAMEAQLLLRHGNIDSHLLVDQHAPNGDRWSALRGTETEPRWARRCTCSLRHEDGSAWYAAEQRFRKYPFAMRIAAAQEGVLSAGGSRQQSEEAAAAMAARVDKVFVGRGWQPGCDMAGAEQQSSLQVASGAVAVRSTTS